MDRRAFLKIGASGLFGALVTRYTRVAFADAAPAARAKACIVLWLNGGPSHIDTFDPKTGPTAGPFKAIKTRARTLTLSEHLPHLAEQADKLAVVRAMSSKEGNHQRAQYYARTGYSPNPTVEHPSLGGWVSARLGDPSGELPAFVSVGGPSLGAGFLGVQYGPLVLARAGGRPENTVLPAGVDDARFERRRAALDALESRFEAETGDPKVTGRRAVYASAVRLMNSPQLERFDLASEPAAIRAAYGDTDFGRGCLLACRLVEAGVKFVEVVLDGWDTHKDGFTREKKLMATLDPAMATLLRELGERHLLGRTVVACLGEFGRTPRINGNDGRDHHPKAWSAVLAGGGIRGGIVHGATDADGTNVVGPAVEVPDLLATIATVMGMSPSYTAIAPSGRPIALTDNGVPVRALLA